MVISDDKIIAIMDEVVSRFLVPKFWELDMNATGEWLHSLETSASNMVGTIRGRDYTEFLQNGRGPGARPPIAPLERWAQAKLGLSGREALSAAFAISNKIAAEGTTWYQKGGSDLMDVLESPECLEYIRGEITTLITVQANAEIEKFVHEVF